MTSSSHREAFSVAPPSMLACLHAPVIRPHARRHTACAAARSPVPSEQPRKSTPLQLALEGADVDAEALLRSLSLHKGDKAAAALALRAPTTDGLLLSRPAVLSPSEAAALRRFVKSRVRGDTVDTVDGEAEHQVNLTRQQLEGVVGAEAVAKLWLLPRALEPTAPARWLQVHVFCRCYSPTTRRQLPVHTDASDFTVNVALSDEASCEGGRLLLLHSGRVNAVTRGEGEATVHRWSLAHGVSAVTAGTRYSLLLFFFHRRLPDG